MGKNEEIKGREKQIKRKKYFFGIILEAKRKTVLQRV
jgi:hypothetical protein